MDIDQLTLVAATKELWHEFFRSYVSDPLMDANPYIYDYECVEREYFRRTSDSSRRYFFIAINDKVVGQIYLKRMNIAEKSTEIGIALINDSVKGKGYGTKAIRLIIDYAFRVLGFERIIADTRISNSRSQHILTKLGFICALENSQFKYYELVLCGRAVR